MQVLVKLLINSLYGFQIRKDIVDFYKCKSQCWMEKEYVDNVLDHWKLPNGTYIVKLKKNEGLEGDNDVEKIWPSHLGAFIFSGNKRIKNKFIKEIN